MLDEDRPLGRGMRIKQEPAFIQDPSIVLGQPAASPQSLLLAVYSALC